MNTLTNWLRNNLQAWTPFSAIIIIIVLVACFVVVWDVIHGIPVPSFVYLFLSIIGGGGAASTAIHSGVKVANGIANSTAKAVVQEAVNATQEGPKS